MIELLARTIRMVQLHFRYNNYKLINPLRSTLINCKNRTASAPIKLQS